MKLQITKRVKTFETTSIIINANYNQENSLIQYLENIEPGLITCEDDLIDLIEKYCKSNNIDICDDYEYDLSLESYEILDEDQYLCLEREVPFKEIKRYI